MRTLIDENTYEIYKDFDYCARMKPIDKESQPSLKEKEEICKLLKIEKNMERKYQKRAELHCHTTRSLEDGMATLEQVIDFARKNEIPAVAITDHGEVPDIREIEMFGNGITKLIYGAELYVVDDCHGIFDSKEKQGTFTFEDEIVITEVETTGVSPVCDEIIKLSAVKLKNGRAIECYSAYVKPVHNLTEEVEEVTGITMTMLSRARKIEDVLPEFLDFLGNAIYAGYNTPFDYGFIEESAKNMQYSFNLPFVNIVLLAHAMLPELESYKPENVADFLKVYYDEDDMLCSIARIYGKLIKMAKEKGFFSFHELNRFYLSDQEYLRSLPTWHTTVLAKNPAGCKRLQQLVLDSKTLYHHKCPKVPLSELLSKREDLLIGSACDVGILAWKVTGGASESAIEETAQIYDFLEIQPCENDEWMIYDEDYWGVRSKEDLIHIRKKVVQLGKRFGIPVVATSDVHYLRKEDAFERSTLREQRGYNYPWQQGLLHFRTTEEMLDAFYFLDEEERYEVVIKNPKMIVEQIEM